MSNISAAGESTAPTSAPAKPQDKLVRVEHSLYVGDLPSQISEKELTEVFSQVAPVLKVRICVPKKAIKTPRAYAYIVYSSDTEVNLAIREFNQTKFSGKPCRVMKSKRGRDAGVPEANIFVKDLPLSLSAVAFHDTYSGFGEILSSKLAVDHENASKGYGFIQFATSEQAQKAISETHGSTLDVDDAKKPLKASLFTPREKRSAPRRAFNNVFFKNLPLDITAEKLKDTWSKYGAITSVFLTEGEDGKPTGTGFINFEDSRAASKVVKDAQKSPADGVHAVRALSRTERERHQARKNAKSS